MKILIVSASDLDGGASRCAYRLHKGLVQAGIDVQMMVWKKKSHDASVLGPSKRQKAINFLQNQTEKKILSLYKKRVPYANFSSGIFSHHLIRRINEVNPDIVNLHWVCGSAVSLHALRKIRQPIVWSLHDMWPFTGGCHYDYECQKYLSDCNSCPILGSKKNYDLSHYLFKQKQKSFAAVENLYLVPSSHWLSNVAKESALLKGRPVEVIHTGLDLNVFKPIDKHLARKILNLPGDKKIVLFGSLHGTADERKGFSFVTKAMNLLNDSQIVLSLLGNFKKHDTEQIMNTKVYNKGVLHDEETLALLYSASDVIVLPSIQENLANICLEGLACGTPVVAFDIGGNSDMIQHQSNGYLAQPFDAHDLARGIKWVLEKEERLHLLSQNARETALHKFNDQHIALQYQHLFNKIYHSSFLFKEIQTKRTNASNISVSTPSCG